MMFGQCIKQIRVSRRFGLREFCIALDYDPSNWSKIERGLMVPPQDPKTVERIGIILGITANTMEALLDYAAIDAGRIPQRILSLPSVVARLPVFFTLAGRKPTVAQLTKLASVLRSTK